MIFVEPNYLGFKVIGKYKSGSTMGFQDKLFSWLSAFQLAP